MSRVDTRALRAEVQELFASGKHKKLAECYRQLEAAEPGQGGWPHKLGELLHRMGDRPGALDALDRAAETYARSGFLMKAIAVCKLSLRIDPKHRQAADRVARLNRERGVTVPPGPAFASAASSLASGKPMTAQPLAAPRPAGPSTPPTTPIELDEVEIDIAIDEDDGRSAEERARAAAALRETPFVAVLGEAAMARLIDAAQLIDVAAGEVLFRQGDTGDALYVLEEGEVVALDEGPPRRELARLRDGAIFGEIALLTDQPRTATIQAAAPSRLLAFDRKTVGEMLAAEPAATAVLLRFLRTRLVTNLLDSSRLFAPFSPEQRIELARRFRLAEGAVGSVLVSEGERARGLHVILAGAAEVVRAVDGGEEIVARLGSGDVFGEISLLEGAAVASVRGVSRTLLLILPAAEFRSLIMTHPPLLEFASELAAARRPQAPAASVDLHLDFV